ncbi:MAG: inositol monophosphatase family protein [Candidatus Eutrophobiaceae bacterium]
MRNPKLNVAIRAALTAGEFILRHVDVAQHLNAKEKAHNDFVTEVDRGAEELIVETLEKIYPSHRFLAEEATENSGEPGDANLDSKRQAASERFKSEEYLWLIEPLDGTTNFLHGFPQFAVSIALSHKGRLVLGVVFDPLRNELFTAARGEGAQLNERRIRVNPQLQLHGALLGTGLPFKDPQLIEASLTSLRAFMPQAAGIRRAGSAALDLAWVACGRLDGFWEFALKPWDMAAGAILIQEAGGLVCDTNGGLDFMLNGNILAANAKLLKVMLKELSQLP